MLVVYLHTGLGAVDILLVIQGAYVCLSTTIVHAGPAFWESLPFLKMSMPGIASASTNMMHPQVAQLL